MILTALQQFCKEVVLWNTLSHPNVLKLVGVQGNMDKGQFTTVSEWMAHGNIMEYIGRNWVNRLELVRGPTTFTTPFTKIWQTVVRGSSGSEVPPRRRYHTWGPQRGQSLLVPRQIRFLTFNRRTSLFPTIVHHGPASQISVL